MVQQGKQPMSLGQVGSVWNLTLAAPPIPVGVEHNGIMIRNT